MHCKYFFLILALMCNGFILRAQEEDPVIMTINDENIHKSEFEYIYNKSKTTNSERKKLKDYIDLFVKFKLKVAAAEAEGLDTLPAFKKELNGYRRKLVQPYLVDKKAEEQVLKEAYDRMAENIELSYIFVGIAEPGMASDTLLAYKKAEKIYKKALESEDFNALAFDYSEDPSAKQNRGYMGYMTAFLVPYPVESRIYAMNVGDVSAPYRFRDGYFIFKVTDRRADRGERRAAHILKLLSKDADSQTKARVEQEIFDIYDRLKKGEDFGQLARELSDDKGSAVKGGELPWFASGRMVKSFEDVAFALEKDEISEPFLSDYGWHIVKLLDKHDFRSFEDVKVEIQQKIRNDVRKDAGKLALVDRLKKEYHFTPNKALYDKLYNMVNNDFPFDSIFISELKQLSGDLFSLNDVKYDISLFVDYIARNPRTQALYAIDAMKEKLDGYEMQTILEYENAHLEEKYPNFSHLIKEYRDGMLLFEISNKNVWEKASKDKEALQQYFLAHQDKYKWDKKHYKGYIVQCTDKEVAKMARRLMKKIPADSINGVLNRTFNADKKQIRLSKGLYEQGKNPIVDKLAYKKGKMPQDSVYTTTFLYGKNLKYKPESYTDVRSDITIDFQNYLEEQWVESLRKRFTVKIYDEVVNSINE